jgi:membrane protein DedA with SNARE-associated domain
MLEEILKAIPVILASAIKFILGPLEGYALKLHPITTALSTLTGMMLSVVSFTYFGDWLKNRFFKKLMVRPTNLSNRRRKFIIVMRKYGLGGIAFFTPLILTPIGGTLLAVGMNKPKEKILFFMFISASFWSTILTLIVYASGRAIMNHFPEFLK